MSSFKHQEQLHDTPHAQACGSAPNSTKLELNNPKARPRSLIDKLANVSGDLWSDGDVQIDGHLCGNVNCAQLIIGKDAAVIGAIIAEEAVIRGKMTGLIRATRVLLQASARVESEIVYQSLSVDEGASRHLAYRLRSSVGLSCKGGHLSPEGDCTERGSWLAIGCAAPRSPIPVSQAAGWRRPGRR
jgi:cytoskeletal protein CcmA (bactofilin family)